MRAYLFRLSVYIFMVAFVCVLDKHKNHIHLESGWWYKPFCFWFWVNAAGGWPMAQRAIYTGGRLTLAHSEHVT